MDALIFGGESPRHQQWVRDVARTLQPHFSAVKFLDYRHWSEGGPTDIEFEIAAAAKLAATSASYTIVAKSIGTIIAVLGIGTTVLRPTRCVFLGLPLGVLRRMPGVIDAIRLLPPTTFVQNEHDPLGSTEEVASFIDVHGNHLATVLKTPGDTHDYVDFEQIAALAQE